MWKDIPAFSGRYEVSENGEIRNAKTKEVRKARINRCGYLQLNFPRNDGTGKSTTKPVHRVVAEVFLPNPNKLPEVNHIDGNKQNNAVYNLEWCTKSENTSHAHRTGLAHSKRGSDHVNSKLTQHDVKEIRTRYSKENISQQKLADEYHVAQATIGRIIRGERYKNG